jgi:hypothetical protein
MKDIKFFATILAEEGIEPFRLAVKNLKYQELSAK